MSNTSRREFLQQGALSTSVLGTSAWATNAKGQDAKLAGISQQAAPDLVLLNGKVLTVDDHQPRVEAFAVKNGNFVAIGSTKEIRTLIGSKTEVIDADGMTVTPGFIDAHTHPAASGIDELRKVNCDLRTIEEIKTTMRRRSKKTPPGRWVMGYKYDDTKLKGGRPLSRKDLDEAVPNHPAQVVHRGGHTAIFNSVAFKMAGIDKTTPDPAGGQLGRDANGELTGFAAEKARDMFNRVAPEPPITRADRAEGVKLVSQIMTASGLTSVHDAETFMDDFTAYQDALTAGDLGFRVYAMAHRELYEALKEARIRTGFGNEFLRVGGLKLYCDGSCSERTMRMSTPYSDRPGYFGILTIGQNELNELVEDAYKHHFQVGVHANGDVAIGMVLKAYERVLKRFPHYQIGSQANQGPRLRIEHCTLVNPSLLRRMAAINAIPTPFYTYVHFHGNKWAAYGQERLQWMFAHRSFLDYKIRVAGASDYVPGPFEPLMAIQSMVTRKDFEGRLWGPAQRISVDDALRVCTINGAYASFEENIKGSITAGKLADFVMLEKDPHHVEPEQIKNISVARTVVGGKTVHLKNS